MSTDEPFDTAAIADRVLAAWAAAPERFREDANAEEDLAHGGYRDRVVVELAQNAADAAARADVPGRLLLRLVDPGEVTGPAAQDVGPAGLLLAANTGTGLDAAGVTALATLRASAKRPGEGATVGRFGVGFSAVLAVTDAPVVLSRTGGVRFSRDQTRALVEETAAAGGPGLQEELDRRQGHVPVLRVPFPAHGTPPDGYDTAVLLPLRDGAARDVVERLLAQVGDGLLLALPGLAEIIVHVGDGPARHVGGVRDRWHVRTRDGVHDPAALADRPTEERQRPGWSVTWAVPRADAAAPSDPLSADPALAQPVSADPSSPDPWADPSSPGPSSSGAAPDTPEQVVHAPTPTQEPLAWPAVLVATFPLDPDRRHVAPGPAARAIVQEAAHGYVDLLTDLAAAGTDVVALVPTGLPAGRLDADLREATLPLLAQAPVLRTVETGDPVRPPDAVGLEPGPWAGDDAVLRPLARVLAGLVAAPRAADPALAALGVRRLSLADLVETVPAQPDAASWCSLFGAFAPLSADPAAREALAGLPMPLLDGRVVRGARAVLRADPSVPGDVVDVLARLGVRVVDPAVAADPAAATLLDRLGVHVAGPVDLLRAEPVRQAVAAVLADDLPVDDGWTPDDLRSAVLALVAAGVDDGLTAAQVPWLADLLLPDTDGGWSPAGELVQPGSPARDLFDDDAMGTLDPDLHAQHPAAVWQAVGVTGGLVVAHEGQIDLTDPPDSFDDVAGFHDWAAEAGEGTVEEVTVVRDLDLVAAARLPDAVLALAADPATRRALLDPAVVDRPDGTRDRVPSWTAWWLRAELDLTGRAAPDADPWLRRLLPPAPEWLTGTDPHVAAALGVVTSWDGLDDAGWADALDTAATTDDPPVAALLDLWRALARTAPHLDRLPARLWALTPAGAEGDPDGDPAPAPDAQGRTGEPGAGDRHAAQARPGEGGAAERPLVPRLVDADRVVVPPAPMWCQRTDLGPLLVVPVADADALADVLDVAVSTDRADGVVAGAGSRADVPTEVAVVLPGAPSVWWEHDDLRVDGVPVDWWVEGTGPSARVHAATLDGLACALAQAAGRWSLRWAVAHVLADPTTADAALITRTWD